MVMHFYTKVILMMSFRVVCIPLFTHPWHVMAHFWLGYG